MIQDEELLSKKELLILTGISYGQLYRWKRQNLIPESWFIKQSSFTGQETFFPKDKILERIRMIIALKDQYSLEELAGLLSPTSTNKIYKSEDMKALQLIDPSVISLFERYFGKNEFAFLELLFMLLFDKMKGQFQAADLEDALKTIKRWFVDMKGTSYRLSVFQRNSQMFMMLRQHECTVLLDEQTQEIQSFDLDVLAKELNAELNNALGEVAD